MDEKSISNCALCKGEGAMTARSVENKGLYVFVCPCDYGQASHWNSEKKLSHDKKAFKIPTWNNAMLKYYDIER